MLLLYLTETITAFRVLWLCEIIVMNYITTTSVSKTSGDANELPLVCTINIQIYFVMGNVDSAEVLVLLLCLIKTLHSVVVSYHDCGNNNHLIFNDS